MIAMQWSEDDYRNCSDDLLSVIIQELSRKPEDD